MTLRSRLILAFALILILAVVPLIMFTSRVAPFNPIFKTKGNIESSLENAVANAKNPEELLVAEKAIQEYRQSSALLEPLRLEFIKFSILLVCGLFLLSVFIVFIYVKYITKPLQELTYVSQKIADGDISMTINNSRDKEFNKLTTSFNFMLESLREAREKLKLTERHTAWQEMSRMLAHEIKNPLTALQLSNQRLREKYLAKSNDLPEVIDKTTKIMESEINNFVTLVGKFSEFARLPSPDKKPTNLNEIIKECIGLYENIPDVKFKENYAETIPEVIIDAGQIKQVVKNIIKNAIEAKAENFEIIVTTKVLSEEVEIVISNNGKAISEEDLKHLFHPYFTTKEGGSGLGLIISERILVAHNGKIEIENNKDKGTRVLIRLPVNKA
jgi:two-component system, NtrC family, nitrogen regulation sensor histidine kinase NtrY